MARDKIIIEVDCEHRNISGACKIDMFSNHCLDCKHGKEKRVKILLEDTVSWGKEASDTLKRREIPRNGLFKFIDTPSRKQGAK